MAKYLVEGFIKVSMEVEADSEDEALEMAGESFDFENNVDAESEPDFQTANLIGADADEDDDEVYVRSSRRGNYDEDEDDN